MVVNIYILPLDRNLVTWMAPPVWYSESALPRGHVSNFLVSSKKCNAKVLSTGGWQFFVWPLVQNDWRTTAPT